jgi:hypothetical protein
MSSYEQIRIAQTTEAERKLIGFLTPEERRDVLVREALTKQRRNDEQLLQDYLERIRSRQLAAAGVDPEGRPYATNGKIFYYPDENEPMTSIGRVPGHENMHVLQKADGSFAFIDAEDLSEMLSEQQRLDEQHFAGEVDRIKARGGKPRLQDS